MSKTFEIQQELTCPVEVAYAVITDPEYWRNRFAEKPDNYELDAVPGAFAITVRDTITADSLPAIVRPVVSGDIVAERRDVWAAPSGDSATGTVNATASGVPLTVEGTLELVPSATGSTLRASGSITVKIPLIGGQIESMMRKMVEDMLVRDRDRIEEWLARA
ncbi:MAG: DUF2505 domain-containing protein [Rhodococcus sp.]|nr:DUF2505 domain-containing protein [Rhodococcus sp. (in: high G+C Gram-positive bacteria)]